MQNNLLILVLLFIFYSILSAQDFFNIIEGGGYSARFCLKTFENFMELKGLTQINCSRTEDRCDEYFYYTCKIPCGFRQPLLYMNNFEKNIRYMKKLNLKLINFPEDFEYNDYLPVIAEGESVNLLHPSQIRFSFPYNISCRNIQIYNILIICSLKLDDIEFDEEKIVNVSVEYGWNCDGPQVLGPIHITRLSLYVKLLNDSWILIAIFPILLAIIYIICYLNNVRKSNAYNFKLQRKFLEYQATSMMNNDVDKFRLGYLLPFHDYMMKNFNVELNIGLNDKITDKLKKFKSMLLDRETLLQWIDKVEENATSKDKGLVASFLTIILLPYPEYFLKMIKSLLLKLVIEMKSQSEEKNLFCRSENIIEKLIGNWITLCLFDSLKGTIGENFFKMCHYITYKTERGLFYVFLKKSKYFSNIENLFQGDIHDKVLKSLKPYINKFIQSITNHKEEITKTKTNILHFSEDLLADGINEDSKEMDLENSYILPIYYLFSYFDEIGASLSIEKDIVREWKNRSVIHQVWANLINNPNFVFSINLSIPMSGSLNTIVNILEESCNTKSVEFSNVLDTSISQKLFLNEMKTYSTWWKKFVDSAVKVSSDQIEILMYNIAQKYIIKKYEVNCLRTLQILSKTIL